MCDITSLTETNYNYHHFYLLFCVCLCQGERLPVAARSHLRKEAARVRILIDEIQSAVLCHDVSSADIGNVVKI